MLPRSLPRVACGRGVWPGHTLCQYWTSHSTIHAESLARRRIAQLTSREGGRQGGRLRAVFDATPRDYPSADARYCDPARHIPPPRARAQDRDRDRDHATTSSRSPFQLRVTSA
eukprot:429133-Rhodomonas_salina.2